MNYTTLKSAVESYLLRTDLDTVFPQWVEMVEGRLRRVVRTKHLSTSSVTALTDTGTLTLPDDLVEVREILHTNPPTGRDPSLSPAPLSGIYSHRAQLSQQTGVPTRYAVIDRTVYLSPVPDDDYSLLVVGEGPFTAITSGTPSNWIMADYPDVYLYGVLVESVPWTREEEQRMSWEQRFAQALAELEIAQERAMFPSTPIQPLPAALG